MKQKKLFPLLLSFLLILAACASPVDTRETSVVSLPLENVLETETTSSTEETSSSVDEINEEINKKISLKETTTVEDTTATQEILAQTSFSLENVPAYSGSAYTVINVNVPFFTDSEITTSSYESYSNLDSLGRCGVAMACVGQDIMPTESRGSIGSVKPTAWHTVKYDCVNGNYLYNRCHLIAYELTGENANARNLITGTRYMNVSGMLPFENLVADFVKETGYHVMYRVTPIFEDNNLLASGVLMEALSVEDSGAGIQFCVYCYNVQPGIIINYANGNSAEDDSTESLEETTVSPADTSENFTLTSKSTYILNTNTKKFHLPTCSSVNKMSASNKQEYTGSREDLIDLGYSPCGNCNP